MKRKQKLKVSRCWVFCACVQENHLGKGWDLEYYCFRIKGGLVLLDEGFLFWADVGGFCEILVLLCNSLNTFIGPDGWI